MANNSYSDLLQNALWQKKRLEIMQRDNFSCVKCGRGINDGTMLNVHHKIYYPNRKPWEYEDNCLETLCVDCHKNEHAIPLKKEKDFSCAEKRPKSAKGHMKIPFYRSLLKPKLNLSPSEKILYSFWAAKSIQQLACYNGENKYIALAEINHCKLARELKMARQTIITGLKNLRNKRFIKTDKYGCESIYVTQQLLEHGFFELYHAEMLTGELLIFYSYLRDKGKNYNNCINTMRYKIALDLNKSQAAIAMMLSRLYDLDLAKRLPNGKLLIK